MVYVVVLRGTPNAVTMAHQQLVLTSNGWEQLGPNVYLVGQEEARAESLRNFLRRQPGVDVAVLQLSGGWATGGNTFGNIAQWLRAAQHMF
jgi:hypothetical protein